MSYHESGHGASGGSKHEGSIGHTGDDAMTSEMVHEVSNLEAPAKPARSFLGLSGTAWSVAVVLTVGLLHLSRRPDQLVRAQLIAEDGSVFFQTAQDDGLDGIVRPYAGYLNLVPRSISELLVSILPVRSIPFAFSFSALLFVMLISWVIFRYASPPFDSPLIPIAVVAVVTSGETILTLTNVQWYGALLLVALPFLDFGTTKSVHFAVGLLAFLISATGPFSIPILAIILVASAMSRRVIANRTVLAFAAVGALAQTIVIVLERRGRNESASDSSAVDGLLKLTAEIGRSIADRYLLGFLDKPNPSAVSVLAVLAVALAIITSAWLLAPRRIRRATTYLAACGLTLWYAVLPRYLEEPAMLSLWDPLGGAGRFYLLPFICLTWMLIVLIHDSSTPSIAVSILLMCALASALAFWRPAPLEDFRWSANIKQIPAGSTRTVEIAPGQWYVDVDGP